MSDSNLTVLYDAPGPKAKRNATIGSVVVGLALLAVLYVVYARLDEKGQFASELWAPLFSPSDEAFQDVWKLIWEGLRNTLAGAVVERGHAGGAAGRFGGLAPTRSTLAGAVVQHGRAAGASPCLAALRPTLAGAVVQHGCAAGASPCLAALRPTLAGAVVQHGRAVGASPRLAPPRPTLLKQQPGGEG